MRLISLVKKKGDFMVHIFMITWSPELTQIQGWPTGDPGQVAEPFDYDKVVTAQVPEGLSQKDQIVSAFLAADCISFYSTSARPLLLRKLLEIKANYLKVCHWYPSEPSR